MRARRGGAWRTLAPWLLASLALVGCHGRARTGAAARAQPRTGPALATFDFSAGLPEAPPENMLGLASRKHTFDEALRAIERARKDGDVKGIFVRFGGAPIGLARAQEIGDALAKARADKPVHCHAEGFTNATYFAAARGCTKIFVAPAGEVETIGLAAQIVYMRKLLVDELKLSVDILQVGKYKGAEEPLTRDGPSEEARASLEGVLSDMRDGWLEGFRASRPAVEKMVEEGPHSAVKAKERGLVDDVSYADEVRDHARTEVGAVRDDWNGFAVLHTAASEAGALDIGFVPGEGGLTAAQMTTFGTLDLVFLLGADEVKAPDGTFVVYVGTHGDRGAHRADVILPGAAYTEKSGLYVNLEGRVQMANRAAFPPGDAREDWAILRALSQVLGKTLPFDSFEALRAKMFADVPALATEGLVDYGWSAPKLPTGASGEFGSPIKDYYLTNAICRASPTMQRCTAELLQGETFAEAAE